MCHSNNFLCTTEANYMYYSTFNLFSAVHDKKKIEHKKRNCSTCHVFKKIFKALQYNYVYYSTHFMYCSTLKFICSTNFKGVTALFPL
jgi:hypothetical protein